MELRVMLAGLFVVFISAQAAWANSEEVRPSAQDGAKVFMQRCVLCHGVDGMGEGVLPLKLKNYPSANLLQPKYGTSAEQLEENIIYGGSRGKMSNFMPPMGNDLTWSQLQSVVHFVQLLRADSMAASKLLRDLDAQKSANRAVGQQVFESRCTLCHGKYGQGDGRMSKIIKNPPPADLTASRLPDDYLIKIINGGGEAVGRSAQMPPWGDQLSESELASLLLYLQFIRNEAQ